MLGSFWFQLGLIGHVGVILVPAGSCRSCWGHTVSSLLGLIGHVRVILVPAGSCRSCVLDHSTVYLLSSHWSDGQAMFRHFLKSEFSEENLDFWLAVEQFKRTRPLSKLAARAAKIYDEFISTNASRQVNVDSSVRESTNQGLRVGVNPVSFQLAQGQILGLMETDCYPRFLRSRLYAQLTRAGQ
uniref:RGS domain-containing protein n=1 Tax=Cyclopterus lumpus TaxID=8103 RepID=A0A8C2WSR6_CYCLU